MSVRGRAGALALVIAVGAALAGCAAAVVEVGARSPGAVTLEAFMVANELGALPRADAWLGGTSEADAALHVTAVVADTPAARARGLMGVASVPEGVGMLFAFPDALGEDRPGFWMLDTLVALDIAFASDGVIVGVATMEPCVRLPCPVTHPGVAYDVALEVASGALAGAGVLPGDRFAWRMTEGSADDAR